MGIGYSHWTFVACALLVKLEVFFGNDQRTKNRERYHAKKCELLSFFWVEYHFS